MKAPKPASHPEPASHEVAEGTGPLDLPHDTIVYVGPAGQQSSVLGSLSVGTRYQVNVQFAAYLVAVHPDFWARPSEPAAAARAKAGKD